MGSKLVSAVEWRKKDGKWTCSLICYDRVFSQIWLEQGISLSFTVQPGRYCVGYTTLSTPANKSQIALEPWKAMEPCPSEAITTKGHQCSSCYQEDLVQPCLLCDGTGCSAEYSVQTSCQKATGYVYLASFGVNRVKVGVAHDSRIPQRWIEQGANLAKRIIVGNGNEIRRFEKAIHDSLNVLSGLRTTEKVDTLWKGQHVDADVRSLSKAEQKIKEHFPQLPFLMGLFTIYLESIIYLC